MILKQEFLENKDFYLNEMKSWKIFIYPTDTVLWIGCIVSNTASIDKIFELKKRDNKPLLIIAPCFDWIEKYCYLSDQNKKYMEEKLPGAYSFILDLKDTNSIYSKVNSGSGSVWVRIPDNWFSGVVRQLWEAFITTSVNISWEPSVVQVWDIPEEILKGVDYVISSEDELSWRSSTVIDLRWDTLIILRK